MVLLRLENISSLYFSGFDWKEFPMTREEFALVMSSHRRWNEVESRVREKGNTGRTYIDCVKVQRKQNVVLTTGNMRFESSGFSILLPNTGPYGPSSNFSLSCNDNVGAGLFETMTELKRYLVEFERARIHWELVTGQLGLIKGKFERFITYGRTMDTVKIRKWAIPTSDSAALESFRTKMENLGYVRGDNSNIYKYSQQKLVCKLIREASHCYPGIAVDNVEFVELVSKQLVRALLKQIILFTMGEYTFDECGPLDEICSLINDFHLPAHYDAVYPSVDGPKPKPELKLPIVTTVLTQGSNLPINFVNLKLDDGSVQKKGGIILNMETRTLVTNDFSKFKTVFDYTKKTNTLTGRITDDIMQMLSGEPEIKLLEHPDLVPVDINKVIMQMLLGEPGTKLLEHPDFVPMDMSPLVKIHNPFPELIIDEMNRITETPQYTEKLVEIKSKLL